MDQRSALALLEWQIELGASEAIGDAPVNRYEVPDTLPKPGAQQNPRAAMDVPTSDPVSVAAALAASADTLDALARALAGYEYCELKQGARTLVFSDGNPQARVMIIGEAPGRDEDLQGKPFVGRAGQLLDLMFDAIGHSRHEPNADLALYITNVLPWRPPQNRDPTPQEIAMMLPFVRRHVELAAPDVLVLMGNHSCQAMLGRKGITRLRGEWTEAVNRPALPMFHPAYLLRNPAAKRHGWHDLLMLQSRLRSP